MPEFVNVEEKSASENAKSLKHVFKSKMKSLKEEKWKNKALHGQYPKILEKPHVDSVTTNKWLSSNLKGETEGLLVAAQDQAINTRNYQKVICGQQVESKCRMCSQHEETVDHILSGCEVLAKTEYITRHNKAAAYLHWRIWRLRHRDYKQMVSAQAWNCGTQYRQQHHHFMGHGSPYW